MPSLADIQSQAVRTLLGNRQLSKPTLAINAGGAATVKTTGTNYFTVDGVEYSYAALSAQVLAADATQQAIITGQAGFYVQPIGKTVYYVLGISAAGVVKTFQGTYANQAFTNFVGRLGDGLVPDIGNSYTPIGMIKVVTGSAAFTPATTALDAANITFTFYDLSVQPATAP